MPNYDTAQAGGMLFLFYVSPFCRYASRNHTHIACVHCCPISCRYSTAQQTDSVQRSVWVNLGDVVLWHNSIFREGADTNKLMNLLILTGDPASAVCKNTLLSFLPTRQRKMSVNVKHIFAKMEILHYNIKKRFHDFLNNLFLMNNTLLCKINKIKNIFNNNE